MSHRHRLPQLMLSRCCRFQVKAAHCLLTVTVLVSWLQHAILR